MNDKKYFPIGSTWRFRRTGKVATVTGHSIVTNRCEVEAGRSNYLRIEFGSERYAPETLLRCARRTA